MSTQIKATYSGEDKCPRCGTAVGETGVIIAPWTWGKQVESFREKLAMDRQLKKEDGVTPDIEAVSVQDAIRAVLTAHGGFLHRCSSLREGEPCNTSFLVTVLDPDSITVQK